MTLHVNLTPISALYLWKDNMNSENSLFVQSLFVANRSRRCKISIALLYRIVPPEGS